MDSKIVDLLNGGSYTDTCPESLTFNGRKYPFSDWTNLATKFFELVQDIYPEKIENLARKKKKEGGCSFLFVKNEEKVKTRKNPLNRTNICLKVNMSADDHIEHIREVIKHCKLDVSSIVIRYHNRYESLLDDESGLSLSSETKDQIITNPEGTIKFVSKSHNFSEDLEKAINKIETLGLEPTLETINAFLSADLGYNLKSYFNFEDDDYRHLINSSYNGVPRVWKDGLYKRLGK